jgi:hypothetical protein
MSGYEMPPPSRGGGDGDNPWSSATPLSNQDFRKLLATPRPGGAAPALGGFKKPQQYRPKPEGDADGGFKKPKAKGKKPSKAKEGEEEGDGKLKYRDRAEERRKGLNVDYQNVDEELSSILQARGVGDAVNPAALSIEDSKFLGGDVEHTHLVKGLDFALLQKVRGWPSPPPPPPRPAAGRCCQATLLSLLMTMLLLLLLLLLSTCAGAPTPCMPANRRNAWRWRSCRRMRRPGRRTRRARCGARRCASPAPQVGGWLAGRRRGGSGAELGPTPLGAGPGCVPLGCWAAGLLASGLLGCWTAGLLGCCAAGLLGCWAAGLLGCWAAGLLGCWAAGLRLHAEGEAVVAACLS